MKNKYIKLFLLTFLFSVFLTGCSGIYDSDEDSSSSKDNCTLQVILDGADSRTAMPEVTTNNLSDLYMFITSPTDDDYYKVCGPYDTYEDFKNAKFAMNKGTYDFYVFGLCETLYYDAEKRFTINDGKNEMSLTLVYLFDASDGDGKGNIEIGIKYPAANVKKAVASLCNTSSEKVSGFDDVDLTLNNGDTTYSVQGVPVGNYVVIIRFYSDNEKTNLIGTYREAAYVSENLTSKSSIEIESLSNTYSILYSNLGVNGDFAADTKYPVSYTRFSGTITLANPVPAAESVEFAGWYDNKDYSGKAVTSFSAMECKDKTFYAKWLHKKTITYHANGGSFSITKDGETSTVDTLKEYAMSGDSFVIKTAADLKMTLKSGTKGFLGWTTSSTGYKAVYQDGSSFTVADDVDLYAVYTASAICSSTDNDTDGDGLSDAYEIQNNMDPNCNDTDGDGWTDKEEIELYDSTKKIFDPRIADLPSLQVEMLNHPTISYNYTATNGSTQTDNFTTTEGVTKGSTTNSTHGTTSSNTHGWKVGVTYKHTFGTDPSNELSISGEYSGNITNGSSYTYSSGQSENYSRTISKGKVLTETESRTITGGSLTARVKVTNTSNIAYTINTLDINLNRIAPNTSNSIIPVGATSSTFPGTVTLDPGASTEFVVSKTFSNKDTVETLMKNSNGIYLNVAGWNVTCNKGDGKSLGDFTGAMTKVAAKCVRVTIDYGVEHKNMSQEVYNVSVKTKYNTEATNVDDQYTSVTLHEIFKTLGLKTQADLDEAGDTTSKPTVVLSDDGKIKSIRDIASQGDHVSGDWFIQVYHSDNNNTEIRMYNDYENPTDASTDLATSSVTYKLSSIHSYKLDDIMVGTHDKVFIFYDRDQDNDGVALSEEDTIGTDDTNADTDGDGLTDYQEIYGFLKGEKIYCTNPLCKDTDGDELLDNTDDDPLSPTLKAVPSINSITYDINGSSKTLESGSFTQISENEYRYRASLGSSSIGEYFSGTVKYKYLGSEVAYSFATSETPGNETYKPFINGEKIIVPYSNGGSSAPKLVIRITAPDGITYGYYYIKYVSDYNSLRNFSVSSTSSGNVRASWNMYSDSRFSNGGYVIISQTLSSVSSSYSPVTSLSKAMINNSSDVIKLDSSAVISGSQNIYVDTSARYMAFGIYGYEDLEASTIAFKCLAYTGSIKMAPPKNGTLKFYPHYIEAVEDHDGGYDPDYYWDVSSNCSEMKVSDLSVNRKSIHDFDDDCERFYNFTNKTDGLESRPGIDYSHPCECSLARNSDHTITISWHCMEADSGSSDDDVGTRTLTMKYNRNTDTWDCSLNGSPFSGSGYGTPSEFTNKNTSFTLDGVTENKFCSNMYLDNKNDGQVCMWFSVQWCWN